VLLVLPGISTVEARSSSRTDASFHPRGVTERARESVWRAGPDLKGRGQPKRHPSLGLRIVVPVALVARLRLRRVRMTLVLRVRIDRDGPRRVGRPVGEGLACLHVLPIGL
jgi:hypothetical protein